jgi:predicted S18 family serine protease
LVDAVTDKATFVSTETGANRFMMQMAALAGLPTTAEEVAALVAKEEQAQAAARREAENAPLVTHANTVAALEARLLVLETELSRVNAANAAAGGAGDAGNRAKRVSQDDTPSVVGDASTAETAASTLTPSE